MSRKYKQLAEEVDPKHRSSKDTKRWCKGRIGVEHATVWKDHWYNFEARSSKRGLASREELACVECGRQFDTRRKEWSSGKLIAALRELKNLSIEELSVEAELAWDKIRDIENGTRSASIKEIKAIAKAIGCDAYLELGGITLKLNGQDPRRFW